MRVSFFVLLLWVCVSCESLKPSEEAKEAARELNTPMLGSGSFGERTEPSDRDPASDSHNVAVAEARPEQLSVPTTRVDVARLKVPVAGRSEFFEKKVIPLYQNTYGNITTSAKVTSNGVDIPKGTFSFSAAYGLLGNMVGAKTESAWQGIRFPEKWNDVVVYFQRENAKADLQQLLTTMVEIKRQYADALKTIAEKKAAGPAPASLTPVPPPQKPDAPDTYYVRANTDGSLSIRMTPFTRK